MDEIVLFLLAGAIVLFGILACVTSARLMGVIADAIEVGVDREEMPSTLIFARGSLQAELTRFIVQVIFVGLGIITLIVTFLPETPNIIRVVSRLLICGAIIGVFLNTRQASKTWRAAIKQRRREQAAEDGPVVGPEEGGEA